MIPFLALNFSSLFMDSHTDEGFGKCFYGLTNVILFLPMLVMNIVSIIIVAKIVVKDKGDIFEKLETLSGFAGCYESPYINFDLNQLKNEFNSTNVQVLGKLCLATLIIQTVLPIFYIWVFWKLRGDVWRVKNLRRIPFP